MIYTIHLLSLQSPDVGQERNGLSDLLSVCTNGRRSDTRDDFDEEVNVHWAYQCDSSAAGWVFIWNMSVGSTFSQRLWRMCCRLKQSVALCASSPTGVPLFIVHRFSASLSMTLYLHCPAPHRTPSHEVMAKMKEISSNYTNRRIAN